jgi:AcrR family transcriptional regulator
VPAETSARPHGASRPLTLTEQARRAQLVQVTTDLVAEHGYARVSLARIAEAAGISKAAVLYHFPTKDAVVRAAYAKVIDALTAYVRAAVEPVAGSAAVEAYIRSLVAYMREHPAHIRIIVDAIAEDTGIDDTPSAASRRHAVAALVEAAVNAGDYRPDTDATSVALIINGSIDAIVAEQLLDPEFDTAHAANELVALLTRALATTR